jgi:L-threonine synthase (EC 4.2.3.1)
MGYWKGLIHAYREYLPVSEKTPIITLYEGNTPLIKAQRIPDMLKVGVELYFKFEGLNPTGSFKDRGMTMAISKAAESGKRAVICASTGNTSASAAAYAARAGMKAFVVLPKGAVALGKLSQAIIYGAKVIALLGNFDDALFIVRKIGEILPVEVVNSVNPYRIEGQKTAAFEIVDALGDAPTYHFIPVGNAGNITAYWKGYKEYHTIGKSKRLPIMMGYQQKDQLL